MDIVNDLESALQRGPDIGDHTRALADALTAADTEGLVDVAYGWVDSPLGPLLAAATPTGLVTLSFALDGAEPLLEELAARISPRVVEHPTRIEPVRRELDEYFSGHRTRFDVAVDWSLTDGFTRRVLEETARIPYGHVTTYGSVAAAAGNPKASRAAGNALASNPIPIVVPCHRVIRSGGGFGGYTGGREKKEALLALEGVMLGG